MNSSKRLPALDIFRGLTIMLMILVNTPGSYVNVYPLLEHAAWEGCTLADLVFPFFLFGVGFSSYFSCNKHGGVLSSTLLKKIISRTITLFLLGIIFNMFPFYQVDQGLSWASISDAWENARIPGILQRIACAYLLGTVLCLWLKSTQRILTIAALLLILHTAGLIWYNPANPYLLEHNLSLAIDLLIPGTAHIYQGFGIPFDPEGFYGTLSAAVTVMAGFLTGRHFCTPGLSPQAAANQFAIYGIGCIAAGLIAGQWIIICKALWTASYVLLTSGIALLVLTLLVHLTESFTLPRKLLQPAQAFGMNSIFFFFASAFFALTFAFPWFMIGPDPVYDWIYNTIFLPIYTPEFGSMLFGLCYVALCSLAAEFLYRRKIFFKI